MTDWSDVQRLIESGETEHLAKELLNLDPLRRKEFAGELKLFERRLRTEDFGRGLFYLQCGLSVAGAALLPNASTVAPWLVRNSFWQPWESTIDSFRHAVDLLRSRDVPWLHDLGTRIAARLSTREPDARMFRLVVELTGDEPPDTDGFLFQLVAIHQSADEPVRTWLRDKPPYRALVPRLIEVVGVGQVFGYSDRAWPRLLVEVADRTTLLDGCLARLQQGGRASESDGFLRLHEEIAPDLDETAARARDYVALLQDSRSTVAGMAQQELNRLDDAGRLTFDLLGDASRSLLIRTEKKLVRAQLSRLDRVAKRERTDEVLLVAATAFGHESADLQSAAASLVLKHFGQVDEATRATLVELAAQLPADLAAKFGDTTAATEPVVELAPPTPRQLPAPIGSPDELAREILSMYGRNREHFDSVQVERVLAALVTFAGQDRAVLGTALAPVFEKFRWITPGPVELSARQYWHSVSPDSELYAVIGAAAAPPLTGFDDLDGERMWLAKAAESRMGALANAVARRLHEIAMGLSYDPRPALVATPTTVSGLIDPAVLAQRLATAEAEGWQPWPEDLGQALHRLPRTVDADVLATARTLTSPAGRQLAAWLEVGGLPDPRVSQVLRVTTKACDLHYRRTEEKSTILATVDSAAIGALPNPEHHSHGYESYGQWMECWPAILPSHRDVIAAHFAPHAAYRRESRGTDGPMLPMLAEADGPVGPGLRLALAYGFGALRPQERANAVDALLILAGRGQLDGAALGEVVGDVAARGDVALNRVVPTLRDAARAGAARQVWDLVTTALPKLWELGRIADLVAFAVELAQQLRPQGTIAGLPEAAGRKGSSRTVVEAKRLLAALGD